MNITYYPFEPFVIQDNKVTVIDVGTSKMYLDLCQGFSEGADTIRVSNEDFELQSVHSQCSWYGDLMLSVDLNKLFLHKIQQRLIQLMDDVRQVALLDKSRELSSEVTDLSFMMDLPLEISTLPDVEKIMKFVGISFPSDIAKNPLELLETLIQTHVELGLHKAIVLTNISHYISKSGFIALTKIVSDLQVKLIDIEFSEFRRVESYENCCYYYVDSDFVDWRKMI